MHNINNPRQGRLFDPFEGLLSAMARKKILFSWPGVMRHVILELMPAGQVAKHFNEGMGRPTKELFAMCGLLFIMEFKNWTKEEAADAYMCHTGVQYALNLDGPMQEMSVRTIERYQLIFIEDEIACRIMGDVTAKLVELLEIDVSKQRVDSTHVCSNMATFGRTRLMGVVTKRFLTQLKRHDLEAYNSLPMDFLERYASSQNRLFADGGKDAESRKRTRQQAAEDLHFLIERFADDKRHNTRQTYKDMARVFSEQCDVVEKKTAVEGQEKSDDDNDESSGDDNSISGNGDREVMLKEKPGGDIMQNPSDPDATYDGHKGPGFQVQVSETCGEENEVQIATCAIPQTAVEYDGNALPAVLDELEKHNMMPTELLADTHYGSDENVLESEKRGVELVSPVSGNNKTGNASIHKLNIDDFVVDEETETIVCCPAGNKPECSIHDKKTGKTTTVMFWGDCHNCKFRVECAIKLTGGRFVLRHTAKERRIDGRRREADTYVFKERYKLRSGVESMFSGIKRITGLARLPVRGSPRVFNSIILKIAGWNVLQAASCSKMRAIVSERALYALFIAIYLMVCAIFALMGRFGQRLAPKNP